MNEITASRTLVKSPPELWAECSDAESLARHLGEFGEIRITKLEPETAVAWEGEEFSGTVRLEPSGWGTKVVITARGETETSPVPQTPGSPEAPAATGVDPQPEPAASVVDSKPGPVDPEPAPDPTPAADRSGLLARLFGRLMRPASAIAAPQPAGPPEPLEPQESPEATTAEPEAPASPPAQVAPPVAPPSEPERHLQTALESLGQAHRRPFSRG